MKRFIFAVLLLGISAIAKAAVVTGPRDYIRITNSLQPSATMYISSGTIRNLNVTTLKFNDGTSQTTAGGGGGGGSSSLEVFNNFVGTRSSPTASVGMSNAFAGSVTGSTFTFALNSSSVTLLGQNIPAVNIAAGTLGTSVRASSFPVSGVTAGSYTNTNLTVNAQGIVTTASSGTGGGLPLTPGDTNYVRITTGSVQNGAFNISSGSVQGTFTTWGVELSTYITRLGSILFYNDGVNMGLGGFPGLGTNTGNTSIGVGANQQYHNGFPNLQNNTAVGNNALNAVVASNNTAIGASARSSGSSTRATAVGSGALSQNTGTDNTAVGYNSGFASSSGGNNSIFGSSAYASGTGVSNAIVGKSAMTTATSADNNAVLGETAMNNLTTGDNNVSIGEASGQTLTIGSSVTLVGYQSNVGSNNLNKATAIGAGAIVYSSNTIQLGSGETVISSGPVVLTTLISAASLATDSAGKIIVGSGGGGGGASSLAVGTGTATNFTNNITSPTAALSALGSQFSVLSVGTTAVLTLNPSTVTLQGSMIVPNQLIVGTTSNVGAQVFIVAPSTVIPLVIQDPIYMDPGGNYGSVDLTDWRNTVGVNLSSVTTDGSFVTSSTMACKYFQLFTPTMTVNGVALQWPSIPGSNGQALTTNGGTPATLSWATVGSGGGGSSTLAVGTGTATNFTTNVTSPTAALSFKGSQFNSVALGSTNTISINYNETASFPFGLSGSTSVFTGLIQSTGTNAHVTITKTSAGGLEYVDITPGIITTQGQSVFPMTNIGTGFLGNTTNYNLTEYEYIPIDGNGSRYGHGYAGLISVSSAPFMRSYMVIGAGGLGGGTTVGSTNYVVVNVSTNGVNKGNVGIGVNDPAYQFQTSSNAFIGGSLTARGLGTTASLLLNVQNANANYVATSTDNVILASSTFVSITTITLPSAITKGQTIQITKVDLSTTPVAIVPLSGQTIVGLSTVTLSAYGVTQELIADGVSTWLPKNGLVHGPSVIGDRGDATTSAAGVANAAYFQAVQVDEACDIYGVQFVVGTQSGNMDIGIYNSNFQLLSSTGSTPVPAAGRNSINFPKTVNLQPGLYYLAMSVDNVAATFTRTGTNTMAGAYSMSTAFPLPATVTLSSVFSVRAFALQGLLYGGLK